MQILNSYPAMPGQCFGCGNSQGRRVLDTERDIDFYGRVYFCELCAADIARQLMIPPPVAETIDLEDLSEHVFRVSNSIDALGDIVAKLSSLAAMDQSQELRDSSENESVGNNASGEPDSEPAQSTATSDDNAGDEGSNGVPERNGNDNDGTNRLPDF